MPKYSFIVPVYNVERYLNRCVESIINQSNPDFEVILVDDGSTDLSSDLCDEWSEKSQHVKVVHKLNGGLSDARNVGLSVANGQYIVFVDSDDYVTNDVCEIIDDLLKYNPDIVVYDAIVSTGGILSHDQSLIGKCVDGAHFLRVSLKKNKMPMAAWLYVYKRTFLKEHDLSFKKGILHEDEQFTPRAILCAERIVYSGKKCYKYEIRPASITTRTDKRNNLSDFFQTCIELNKIYDSVCCVELRMLLKDSLAEKYLSLFKSGCLFLFKDVVPQKMFVLQNSKRMKTLIKSMLFAVSPRLYCEINMIMKKKK